MAAAIGAALLGLLAFAGRVAIATVVVLTILDVADVDVRGLVDLARAGDRCGATDPSAGSPTADDG